MISWGIIGRHSERTRRSNRWSNKSTDQRQGHDGGGFDMHAQASGQEKISLCFFHLVLLIVYVYQISWRILLTLYLTFRLLLEFWLAIKLSYPAINRQYFVFVSFYHGEVTTGSDWNLKCNVMPCFIWDPSATTDHWEKTSEKWEKYLDLAREQKHS